MCRCSCVWHPFVGARLVVAKHMWRTELGERRWTSSFRTDKLCLLKKGPVGIVSQSIMLIVHFNEFRKNNQPKDMAKIHPPAPGETSCELENFTCLLNPCFCLHPNCTFVTTAWDQKELSPGSWRTGYRWACFWAKTKTKNPAGKESLRVNQKKKRSPWSRSIEWHAPLHMEFLSDVSWLWFPSEPNKSFSRTRTCEMATSNT